MIEQVSVEKVRQRQWGDLVWFRCKWPEGKRLEASPGQFFQVLTKREDVFLPRPISVFWADAEGVEFLVRIRGRGTEGIVESSKLKLIGPLGNQFEFGSARGRFGLLAGGVGLAPLHFLARSLKDRGVEFVLVWAVREGEQARSLIDDLLGWDVILFSEDGSAGKVGDGLVAARHLLEFRVSELVVCAPVKMMEAVFEEAKGSGVERMQFSLEANMACGWGACKGCLTEFAGQRLYVCKEGPIVRFSGDGKILG